ncbi:unnamed protein product [Discula destructiva]
MAAETNYVIYVVRHDLRCSDNPILHRLASNNDHGFTHLLPVYVFPAQQIEVSGFIKDGSLSPYPAAKSKVSKVWRTGPHRAKFITHDVVSDLIDSLSEKGEKVGGVWITQEEGVEERRDQKTFAEICVKTGATLTLFEDEKYFVHDHDVPTPIKDIPDIFTTYRKSIEPLREKPRATLPKPEKGKLPQFPDATQLPSQRSPFVIPAGCDELQEAVLSPVRDFLPGIPPFPDGAESAHPFSGGETSAHERLRYLIKEGLMHSYKETRNGLLGAAFSTKLSAFLSQGCITARQIHHELVKYEDGTDPEYEHAKGYNEGENEGTSAVRFELLWRDYMRLCTKKFRHRLFSRDGFQRHGGYDKPTESTPQRPKWKTMVEEEALPDQKPSPDEIAAIMDRFNAGTTGMGLIDASQRELLHTGYTSNRARQNVASFLTKHLGIDWRIGAEWYELLLVDYDVSSNWANWQYVAGVGNDPRGEARIFNPVKQAFDYDKDGAYVKAWVPEVKCLEKLENVFQLCTASQEDLEKAGLTDNAMATDPVKRIEFLVDGKPKSNKRPFHRARGSRRPSGGFMHGDALPGSPGPDGVYRGGSSFRGRGGYGQGPRRGYYNGRGRSGPPFQPNYLQNYFVGPPGHHQQHPPMPMGFHRDPGYVMAGPDLGRGYQPVYIPHPSAYGNPHPHPPPPPPPPPPQA